MSKKLNIIEAMKMPIGTEFDTIFKDEYDADDNIIIEKCDGGTRLIWKHSGRPVYCGNELINATFIPVQKPVSFMEVVSSDKRCRVEHKYVDVIKARTNQQSLYIADFRNDNYIPLNYLMNILGYSSSEENIRQIINEGKWYIED